MNLSGTVLWDSGTSNVERRAEVEVMKPLESRKAVPIASVYAQHTRVPNLVFHTTRP